MLGRRGERREYEWMDESGKQYKSPRECTEIEGERRRRGAAGNNGSIDVWRDIQLSSSFLPLFSRKNRRDSAALPPSSSLIIKLIWRLEATANERGLLPLLCFGKTRKFTRSPAHTRAHHSLVVVEEEEEEKKKIIPPSSSFPLGPSVHLPNDACMLVS